MKAATMVWGASSGAGKSLLATALCRWAAREGLDVAPFKAQNMSNNARVVPLAAAAGGDAAGRGGDDRDEGCDSGDRDEAGGRGRDFGEIGSAQYFQALAARTLPQVDMNPVLLKPERDTASQVVLQGRVDSRLSRLPWRERSAALAAAARESFCRLAARHDRLIVEGAGSPAEINLSAQDFVNLDTARWVRDSAGEDALRALLVADIDRGGAFAHLYGTWSLLPDDLRPALAGFVLNKFRGDAGLLSPGPELLQARTGVPLLGVLPMERDHGLPDEDGPQQWSAGSPFSAQRPRIAVVAWPHLSNLDEFHSLSVAASLRWARCAAELHDVDWIVLPGSKQASGDLGWLRAQGLVEPIRRHLRHDRPLLGVCGGMQVLGEILDDPDGVDGEPHGPVPGLGLLPLETRYAPPKRLRTTPVRFGPLSGSWRALAGLEVPAYEIRCGLTRARSAAARPALFDAEGRTIGWQAGPVLGIAAHGLFEDAGVLRALFGATVRTLDDSFDALAGLVDEHLGAATLRSLLQA